MWENVRKSTENGLGAAFGPIWKGFWSWTWGNDLDIDKDGFKYVVLSEWDKQRKVYLLALKFPRGKGYENVMRLKEEEERKLKRLKQKARRKLGRHHRGLKELRKSLQRYWNEPVEADE